MAKPKPEPAPKPGKRGRAGRASHLRHRGSDTPAMQLNRDLKENSGRFCPRLRLGLQKETAGQDRILARLKAHLDVIDGDIPVSFILTSASLHDSQVAIPLGTDDR